MTQDIQTGEVQVINDVKLHKGQRVGLLLGNVLFSADQAFSGELDAECIENHLKLVSEERTSFCRRNNTGHVEIISSPPVETSLEVNSPRFGPGGVMSGYLQNGAKQRKLHLGIGFLGDDALTASELDPKIVKGRTNLRISEDGSAVADKRIEKLSTLSLDPRDLLANRKHVTRCTMDMVNSAVAAGLDSENSDEDGDKKPRAKPTKKTARSPPRAAARRKRDSDSDYSDGDGKPAAKRGRFGRVGGRI